MIFGAIVTFAVGAVLILLGFLLWKKEKVSLLHDYHYKNVSEKDKKAFSALSGIGIISVGSGTLITATLLAFTNSALSFISFGIGFITGLALLIYAGLKYNR